MKQALDSLIEACSAAIKENQPVFPPNKTLYHLTSYDGLFGIVSSKCLWASLATTSNDCLEVGYGIDLAMDLLQERLRQRATNYDIALYAYLHDLSIAAPPELQLEIRQFIVSFCAQCDKSGQWLNYGQSGRGVAVGFSPSIANIHKSCNLWKVDYSIKSQRMRMRKLIEIGSVMIDNGEIDPRFVAHVISTYIRLLAIRMKHCSFADEKEWRLITQSLMIDGKSIERPEDIIDIKYRPRGDHLIPYKELCFNERASEYIKEIVIGYSSNIEPNAVQILLRDNGYLATVRRSEVPVRPA